MFFGSGGFEGKAGSSIDSWLSIARTFLGIGEGETDREVALLPWEFGLDESKDSDDELGLGDRLGMLGNGLFEEVVGSMMVGLPFIAIMVNQRHGCSSDLHE